MTPSPPIFPSICSSTGTVPARPRYLRERFRTTPGPPCWGETTFGKGLVQNIEPLSNGGAVKVTIAVYLTPKGRDINETGITPDAVAPDYPATEDVDETLEKALDLIASGG